MPKDRGSNLFFIKAEVFILSFLIFTAGCTQENSSTVSSAKQESGFNNASRYAPKQKVLDNRIDDMALVPAGEFIMGTDDVDEEGTSLELGLIKPFYIDEHPAHRVYLDAYYMDRYEVTNKKFQTFADSLGYDVPRTWKDRKYPEGKENFPVGWVNWFAASNYCSFNEKYLPSEAQWEKAARGTDGRKYPWGDVFDKNKSNSLGLIKAIPKPVGSYESGKSPYGLYDMVGNVHEWVDSWYNPYPGSTYKSDDYGKSFRVLRGGSYAESGHFWGVDDIDKLLETIAANISTTTYRIYFPPQRAFADAGFRCAKKVDS